MERCADHENSEDYRPERGWRSVRNRRMSPRKEQQIAYPRRNERYSRTGPLSPLRSPLRSEVDRNKAKGSRRFSESRKRTKEQMESLKSEDDIKLEPITSITRQIEDLAANSPPWAVIEQKNYSKHVDDQEFPSLDAKYTPEPRKSLDDSTSSTLSWASQVEEQEMLGKRNNSSKRRLVLNDYKPSSSSGNRRSNFSRRPAKVGRLSEPKPEDLEKDEQVIKRRDKQINYGKNTEGYRRYSLSVAKHERSPNHPWTPDKRMKFSRRSWDMQVRIWRRQLHIWDPPSQSGQDDASSVCSSDLETSNTAMEIESNPDSFHESPEVTPRHSQESDKTGMHAIREEPAEVDEEFLEL